MGTGTWQLHPNASLPRALGSHKGCPVMRIKAAAAATAAAASIVIMSINNMY